MAINRKGDASRPLDQGEHEARGAPDTPPASPGKSAWVEPKLEFVEPKLTMHGDLHRLTGSFFGTFSP
ncbi:MAG: hypothetical protein PVH31_04530 [Ectothiorhodospiraceae bacterium]|jgi:hypothetical protein